MVTSEQIQVGLNSIVDFERRVNVGLTCCEEVVPGQVCKRGSTVNSLLMRSLSLDRSAPLGLVHTDVRAGNSFSEIDGTMGLFDWAIARSQGTETWPTLSRQR